MLTLWQTNILRGTRLAVLDEVANGLSYYDYTFLRELPRFYATLEDQLAAADPAWSGTELPSFLRMGSWIGGDRDGNPFVTAEVLRQAMLLQSDRALGFYLDELHLLGGELSLDGRLVGVSDELAALGGALARPFAASAQRALSARDHRHLCAAGGDGLGARSARSRRSTRSARRRLIPHVGELCADLGDPASFAGRERLGDAGARAGCGRCAAPSTCSASIWRASTCGRTPTCTSAPSPSCSRSAVPAPAMPTLGESGASPCC